MRDLSYLNNLETTSESTTMHGTGLQAFNNDSKAIAIMRQINSLIKQKKAIEAQEAEVRENLEKVMADYNVKSFENDILKVVYVEPTTRTTVDSKALKIECPEIYEKYSKTSEIKASVRISAK